MTKYMRVAALPPRRDDYAGPDTEALPPDVDPTTPGVTIYYDQSEGGTEPGAGGPPVAWRVYYDASVSGLQASNVQDALDLLDNQVDNITGASSSLDGRVTTLEAEMDTAQADIVALQGRMTTAEGNITTLHSDLATLTSRVDTTETDITALQGRMTTAEGNITNLQGRMTTAEGSIANLQGRMTTAEGNITNLQGRMTTAEGTLASHTATLDDHETRIDTLEASMATAQANITTLQGRTGQATETVVGVAELATTAEVTAGTDDLRIVTPLKLAQKLSGFTYAQATEALAGIAKIATSAQVTAGTDDATIVTPKKLAGMIAAGPYVVKTGDNMTGQLGINLTSAATPYALSMTHSANWASIYMKGSAAGNEGCAIDMFTAGTTQHQIASYNGMLRFWSSQINNDFVRFKPGTNAAILNALGVLREPTPGLHFHVNYTGDVYSVVQTDSANIAVSRLITPQSDYGWCANGGANGLYLWDYKRGVSPFSIDANAIYLTNAHLGIKTNDFSANQTVHVYDSGYAHLMVNTGTNYWARVSLKNTVRWWDINVEPGGKLVINDETGGVPRLTINTSNGAVYTSGALGVGTDPGQALHVYSGGTFVNALVQSGQNGQARVGVQTPQRYYGMCAIGTDLQFWDLTANASRLGINASGDVFMGVMNAYQAGPARVDIWGYAYVQNYVNTPYLTGGPAGAGVLQGYGPQNKFCFRWDGTNFYVRIDEVQERRISIV